MRLAHNQILRELQKLKDWKYESGKIRREFMFPNFPTAVLFVNKLVDACEEIDHHPEITIRYNRVMLTLVDHAQGAVSDKDLKLVQLINDIL